jgi:hypothetical protein
MHVWVLLYRGRERRPGRKVRMCVLVHRILCAIIWVGRFLGAVFRYKTPIPTFPLDSLLSLPSLREQSVWYYVRTYFDALHVHVRIYISLKYACILSLVHIYNICCIYMFIYLTSKHIWYTLWLFIFFSIISSLCW